MVPFGLIWKIWTNLEKIMLRQRPNLATGGVLFSKSFTSRSQFGPNFQYRSRQLPISTKIHHNHHWLIIPVDKWIQEKRTVFGENFNSYPSFNLVGRHLLSNLPSLLGARNSRHVRRCDLSYHDSCSRELIAQSNSLLTPHAARRNHKCVKLRLSRGRHAGRVYFSAAPHWKSSQ